MTMENEKENPNAKAQFIEYAKEHFDQAPWAPMMKYHLPDFVKYAKDHSDDIEGALIGFLTYAWMYAFNPKNG